MASRLPRPYLIRDDIPTWVRERYRSYEAYLISHRRADARRRGTERRRAANRKAAKKKMLRYKRQFGFARPSNDFLSFQSEVDRYLTNQRERKRWAATWSRHQLSFPEWRRVHAQEDPSPPIKDQVGGKEAPREPHIAPE